MGALSKMQIPSNEKISLNLMHGFITFQIYLNTTKSFTIEIAITNTNNTKKRILLSACSKEFIKNQLHCRIPIINIPTGIWINFSIDILSFVSECFKGQSFREIDSICLSADCKIRRICGMRQLYSISEEEYLQGNDYILPKGFILPKEVKSVNINFDMDYINQTIDIKNIKDNLHTSKDKRIQNKTSQSRRIINKNKNIINNIGNKNIKNDFRSKSINKPKRRSNMDTNYAYNNNLNFKNSGSIKNMNNFKLENHKTEKNKNFFLAKKPTKEINSKSSGKLKANTMVKKNSIKNDNLFKSSNNNIAINPNLNSQKNIVVENNKMNDLYKNNINIQNVKKETRFLNTFNYRELESKETTLINNQSNFNNASISEIVDLEINNTLKNLDNEYNNDIIIIDNKHQNEKENKNQQQIDPILEDKLFKVNDSEVENNRPYTPPLQKIIPVNKENNPIVINSSLYKVNESIMKNHYSDLIYDKQSGRYFDTKRKIFYDLK